MKGPSGEHITLTCHLYAHEDCNGETYYGSIFRNPIKCECQCHSEDEANS